MYSVWSPGYVFRRNKYTSAAGMTVVVPGATMGHPIPPTKMVTLNGDVGARFWTARMSSSPPGVDGITTPDRPTMMGERSEKDVNPDVTTDSAPVPYIREVSEMRRKAEEYSVNITMVVSFQDSTCSIGTATHADDTGMNTDAPFGWICTSNATPVFDRRSTLPRFAPVRVNFRTMSTAF